MSGSNFHDSIRGHYTIPAPHASNGGTINFNFDSSSLPGQSQAPGPFSTVPFLPDQEFVERPGISAWLREKCDQLGSRAALIGLGGVGKSQLAIQHAHHVRQQYPSTYVFWVHAGTRLRFEEAYRGIADRLQLPGRNNPQVNVLRLVYDWLCREENGKWLMIIDNADDINVFYPNGLDPLASFLPQSSNGRILVTSRSRDAAERLTGSSWNVLSVSAMDDDQAKQLLQTKLRDKYDENVATSLVHALECMPLAITHASAYILRRTPRMSPSKYLEEFQKSDKKKASLLNRDISDLRRDPSAANSIVTTWQITFEQIQQERRSAADLLSFMSLFNPQGIPEWVLRSYQRRKPDEETDADNDEASEDESGDEEFYDDLEVLRGYSLVNVQDDVYEMHALVQLCTRVWLSESEMEKWRRTFLQVMSEGYPPGEFENWAKCQQLEPHIEQILEVEPTNEEDAKTWTRLLTNAGWYRWLIGRYDFAERILKRAIVIRERMYGETHVETLLSLGIICLVLRQRGKYEEAEQMNRRVFSAYQEVLGEDHPNTLTSADNLASVLQSQGKYEEAEKMDRQTLSSRERVLGKDHPHTLTSTANFASILRNQRKYEEAEEMCRRALRGYEKALGKDHPDTLATADNLSLILQKRGKYEEAEQLSRRTLSGREAVLGKDHPHTNTSVANLALVLQYQKKYEEAEQTRRRAIDSWEETLGKDHPDTLMSVWCLASLVQEQKRLEEADGLYHRAYSGFLKALGPSHPTTLRCKRLHDGLKKKMASKG